MTRLILVDRTAEFYPVVFRLYRKLEHDIKDKETGDVIAKKGDPDRHTFVNVTLYRRVVGSVETVRSKIDEMKKMLINSPKTFYQLMNAPETDAERAKRYKDNELEVQKEGVPITEVAFIKETPKVEAPKPVNDEEVTKLAEHFNSTRVPRPSSKKAQKKAAKKSKEIVAEAAQAA